MERDVTHFIDLLGAAVSKITPEYFQLPIADGDVVYRERVYCYELYHQLRCGWGAFPFSLGGEVDKTGHPHFEDGPYARAKPDLLVHMPGNMQRNLVVLEVKVARARDEELREDLRKLTWFCKQALYFQGVLLLYGEAGDVHSLGARLRGLVDDLVTPGVLTCLYHRRIGEGPVSVALL